MLTLTPHLKRIFSARTLAGALSAGIVLTGFGFSLNATLVESRAQANARALASATFEHEQALANLLLADASAELTAAREVASSAPGNVGAATENLDALDAELAMATRQLEGLSNTLRSDLGATELAERQPGVWDRLWTAPTALAADVDHLNATSGRISDVSSTLGESLDSIAALVPAVEADIQSEADRIAAEEAARLAAEEEAARIAAEQNSGGGGNWSGGGGSGDNGWTGGGDPLSRYIAIDIVSSLSGANVVFDDASCGGGSATYACGLVWTNDPWTVHLSANTDWAAAGYAGRYIAAHEAMHVRHFGAKRDQLTSLYGLSTHLDAREQAADCAASMIGYGAYTYGCPGGIASEIGSILAWG